MTQTEATGRIRIKTVPSGDAPLEIRQAWVGLVLPCYAMAGYDPGRARTLKGLELKLNPYGYHCPQDLALQVLDKRAPGAAAWWRSEGFPHSNKNFCFTLAEAEIISGVQMQKVRVADDMETGVFELPGR